MRERPVVARLYGPTGAFEKEYQLPEYREYVEVAVMPRIRFNWNPDITAPVSVLRIHSVRYECSGPDYDCPRDRHSDVFRYDFTLP